LEFIFSGILGDSLSLSLSQLLKIIVPFLSVLPSSLVFDEESTDIQFVFLRQGGVFLFLLSRYFSLF
jgi:hypothetical protein